MNGSSRQTYRSMIQVLDMPDGSRVEILPAGGRILGLFAPGSDQNFLWTHPDLEREESARALLQSEGWRNTGGDRTWLTPELDIFFPNYPETDPHFAPLALDACPYEVRRENGGLRMDGEFTLWLARPKQQVRVGLSKTVEPAASPLRHEKGMGSASLGYAGYTLKTELRLLGSDARDSGPIGVWNLLQLPHGGEILVPTHVRATPRVLFGDVVADDLVMRDHLVRFRCAAPGEQKIAMRAVVLTGRAGYLYRTKDHWALVVRNFAVNPSGEYVDVPKDEPDDLGYAFHAVNVDSGLGKFCELEYHVPAIGAGTGCIGCEDTSQVWAFRGSRKDILSVAALLLAPQSSVR